MSQAAPPIAERSIAVIILAAGKGTRMNSQRHKVLHEIGGKSMIEHLLDEVGHLSPQRTVVVVGEAREQLEERLAKRVAFAAQDQQLGTGHAVLQCREALDGFVGDVLIMYGDVPFVRADTMRMMVKRLHGEDAPAVVVLGFKPWEPRQYGRILADGDRITKMVEFKDATPEERESPLCNSGLMAVRGDILFTLLGAVGNDNAQAEFYLPDIVNVAIAADIPTAVVMVNNPDEVAGINSRGELADAEARFQRLRRDKAMAGGVTLLAPDTVFFSHDTDLGRDVLVEQNVVFGPGVSVADNVRIRAFSHLEGAKLAAGSEVGPFARLRPGAVLQAGAKVGNFVEIKNATLGEGAKASHLSYLGDASVGAGANIGAGTITCNYDGYFKHRTEIGAGAFIGSNSSLIAPVRIGVDAIVAAGSAVSRDVADGELRMVRAEQLVKPGWADRFHDAMKKKKEALKK